MTFTSRLYVYTSLLTLWVVSTTAIAQYDSGTGEPNHPYVIATASQLNALGQDPNSWSKHFRLSADIDLGKVTYKKAVIAWDIDDHNFRFDGTPFTGSFDGNGYSIINLSIDTGSVEQGQDYLGLFGYLGDGAVIKNLELEQVTIRGGTNSDYIGALAGHAFLVHIENCSVTGTLQSQLNTQYLGGLVGYGEPWTIKQCRSTCSVSAGDGSSFLGNMIGCLRGEISDCEASGSVTGGARAAAIGGLVGKAYKATLTGCSSQGEVTGGAGSYELGGLVGSCWETTLAACTSATNVSGGVSASSLGGLLGQGQNVSLQGSHSTGRITGDSLAFMLGGLVGHLNDSTIDDCHSEASVTGATEAFDLGGLIGRVEESALVRCWAQGAVSGGINVDYMGGLIGNYRRSDALTVRCIPRIVDCNATGSVTGSENSDRVGGLIGNFDEGAVVYHSFATGAVHAEEEVGGLIGWNDGEVRNSFATGKITGEYDADRLGGLIGRNSDGHIESCYATGAIVGAYNSDHLGGLAGKNEGSILDCYATGSVTGGVEAEDLGGLVGYNSQNGSRIQYCYATGKVSAPSNAKSIGGLVGLLGNGSIYNCVWNAQSAGVSRGIGDISNKADGHEIHNLSVSQMTNQTHYEDLHWQFTNPAPYGPFDNWIFREEDRLPVLRWQYEQELLLPTFAGGSGTADDPYLIATPEDLAQVGCSPRLLDKHFKMIADLDLTEADLLPVIGKRYAPFSGSFDGQHHQITGFHGVHTRGILFSPRLRSGDPRGMFGVLEDGAEVKNLNLSVQYAETEGPAQGGLVGVLHQGTIQNCHVTGSLNGKDHAGGLVGFNYQGTVQQCSAAVTLNGRRSVGGLIGFNDGKLAVCFTDGSSSGHWRTGGLVGENAGLIQNCYSSAVVSGESATGGLVGQNRGSIERCYSTGQVTGKYSIGGCVGMNSDTVAACFWDTESSTQPQGHVGTGHITAKMQQAQTYLSVGWDFTNESTNGTDDIWWINEGADYPRLWWERSEGE